MATTPASGSWSSLGVTVESGPSDRRGLDGLRPHWPLSTLPVWRRWSRCRAAPMRLRHRCATTARSNSGSSRGRSGTRVRTLAPQRCTSCSMIVPGRANSSAGFRSVPFGDLRALLQHLGFAERIRGDHHIFTRDGVAEILNLQPRAGKAKVYQVKQVRAVITSYGLAGHPHGEEASGEEASPPAAEENNDG